MSPVSYQPQANGHSNALANGKPPADVLASKKLQLLEEPSANGFSINNNKSQEEVFQDTQTLGAHAAGKRSTQDEEPILIFDTQSNTSVAQTARDQFAAALLRLQYGVDVSSQRLDAVEAKVDNLTKQQRQSKLQQGKSESRRSDSWAAILQGRGKFGTLLYLSWPVFVFFTLRALEKRSMLKKLT